MHQRHLTLFLSSAPHEFIAVDLLEPLACIGKENPYVMIITERYSNLTRAIRTTKTSTAYVAPIIFDNWPIQYGISNYLLTENGPLFFAKLFKKLCLRLQV